MRIVRNFLSAAACALAVFAAYGNAHAQQAPALQAQAASFPEPVFDVSAIHLHESQPHEHNSIWSSPFDGKFKAENISALALIHWAYEMPESRVVGAPEWAASTHFNIDAAADPSLDPQLKSMTSDAGRQLKEKMVEALLADRFKLVAHSETRDLPIYNLVVAKGGPRLGPLKESGSSVSTGYGRIDVQMANSVSVLAEELSKTAGRDVIDKTGIAGRYDLKLRFTPDQGPAMLNGQPVSDPPPDLFTALQEQLGLKLEPAKGSVEVLVIDHIEMPSEN
jgi:uncharacterized protein (TIGR03435 family)